MPLLPDPEPRRRHFAFISVDDHLIEPPDLFDGRMPASFADRAPKLVEFDDGRQAWAYEDNLFPNVGLNAVVGRPQDEWTMEPARFDEMRTGCWDIHARVVDMDLAGIWASLCFPSLIAGFAGAAFVRSHDPDLGLACVRVERLAPRSVGWHVPASASSRCNSRGCATPRSPRATSAATPSAGSRRSRSPRARTTSTCRRCTRTTGTRSCACARRPGPSSVSTPGRARSRRRAHPSRRSNRSHHPLPGARHAGGGGLVVGAHSVAVPALNVAFSEGGIGWVPMLLDRLDYVMAHSGIGGAGVWHGDVTPSEAVQRNFWFCSIDDPTTLRVR